MVDGEEYRAKKDINPTNTPGQPSAVRAWDENDQSSGRRVSQFGALGLPFMSCHTSRDAWEEFVTQRTAKI